MMSLLGVGCQAKPRPVIGLGDLPYPLDALEPYISSRTLTFHHKKHHKNYVDTLNRLIKGTSYRNMSLSEIVKRSSEDPNAPKIFNQAAQVFNHDFYWKSMKPGGGGATDRIHGSSHQRFIWQLSPILQRLFRDCLGSVRERLGVVDPGFANASHHRHVERRYAGRRRTAAAALH